MGVHVCIIVQVTTDNKVSFAEKPFK